MVVLVLIVVSLVQSSISYTVTFGGLRGLLPAFDALLASALIGVRIAILVLLLALWTMNRKRALFRAIIVANIFCTLALLLHTYKLIEVLIGVSSRAIDTLILDVVLMALANILLFSIWYWIIDPPGIEQTPRTDEPWDFLFPQRGGGVPNYETWVPRYADYLFVAFTTSFAFSPTDALPLTRRAKMLMLLQATISIVTLTGIAGSAINILAGGR